MSCYIRIYIILFAIITGAVNLKQCSKRRLNDGTKIGLVYVSTFVYWNNCSNNVGATDMNISLNVSPRLQNT